MRSWNLMWLLLLLAVPLQAQEEYQQMIKISEDIVRNAFLTFQKLVTKNNFQKMGFESLAELYKINLGSAFPHYMVRLGQLHDYNLGDSPELFLTTTNHLIYPLNDDGVVRASITVALLNGEVKTAAYGSPRLSRALAGAIKKCYVYRCYSRICNSISRYSGE